MSYNERVTGFRTRTELPADSPYIPQRVGSIAEFPKDNHYV